MVLVLRGVLVRDARQKWAGVSDWFGPMRFKGGLSVGESFGFGRLLGLVVKLAPSRVR